MEGRRAASDRGSSRAVRGAAPVRNAQGADRYRTRPTAPARRAPHAGRLPRSVPRSRRCRGGWLRPGHRSVTSAGRDGAIRRPGPRLVARAAGFPEPLHRPRGAAGGPVRVGGRQGHAVGADPGQPRGARRSDPRAAGGTGEEAPGGPSRRPGEELGCTGHRRPDPRGPGARRRPRHPGLPVPCRLGGEPGRARRRPHRDLLRWIRHRRGTAVLRPPAPRPRRPWRCVRGARLGAQPRGGAEADPRPTRRRPRQPPTVPHRGGNHRRPGAPRNRSSLRSGNLQRRPPLLRHAVHQGR